MSLTVLQWLYISALLQWFCIIGLATIKKNKGDYLMKDRVFGDFNTFKLSQLSGKTLKILTTSDGKHTIIMGKDIEEGTIYILGEEINE